jgi:xanthine dehydrogenase YagR molybdenum-binding subunit
MSGTAQSSSAHIGSDVARVDGRLKVTGGAHYASDQAVQNPAYAYLAVSSIARGRISSIDSGAARAVVGVLDILTHQNVGDRIKPGKTFAQHGYMGSSIAPLASDRIMHAGQIVAMVVADSFEAAREAAHKLRIAYVEEIPAATFDSPGAETVDAAAGGEGYRDPEIGDAEAAFASAPIKIDQHYSTPVQHHNPIELFTTLCAWSGGKLTIWEPSQNVGGFKNGVAEQLGISAEDVRVVSPFVGGAFGSRGSLSQRTAIVALAAQRLNRPVKLAVTRQQGFTIATFRAETRHRIKLAAGQDGRLQALSHEGWEATSRPDIFKVAGTDASTRLYACPNIASKVRIVHVDRNTPGFMRSPPETPYLFALESAVDELAYALKMDPVEFRRVNDTDKEPIKGLPYTSRSLMPCFDAAAARFGWAKRNPEPGSMREGDWQLGWGCAATMYPTQMAPASARVRLAPDGSVKVQTAAHDVGTGAYTAIALTAADRLGVPIDQVSVELGDSDLPPAPVAGGSNTTASVCTVVARACDDIRDRIAQAAVTAEQGPLRGTDPSTLMLRDGALASPDGRSEALAKAIGRASNGALEVYAENIPHGVPQDGMKKLYSGLPTLAGGANLKDRVQFAFGAQFVEVRIHRLTREVRVGRAVGAFAFGRIVSPRTAESQLMGGMIWGISAALHEATEIDLHTARYYNDDLAEYLIPVNADIRGVDVIMVPETDEQVNSLGIKGVGELGNVGMNAAVANAVFHATGRRIRDLPVRIEQLL